MNLLDAIIRETERQRRPDIGIAFKASLERNADAYRYLADLKRLTRLSERSGPKGALAGHLEELLRHA